MLKIEQLPIEFNCYTKWGNKISNVLDQKDCNNCWAYCTSQCFTDRIRIKSKYGISKKEIIINNNKITVNEDIIKKTNLDLLNKSIQLHNETHYDMLSPYYFTSCKICDIKKYNPSSHNVFDLNSFDFCNMGCDGGYLKHSHVYLLLKGLPCMSHYTSNDLSVCYLKDTYNFKAKNIYRVTNSNMSNLEKQKYIMNEIYFNGPVSCGFIMYDDFDYNTSFDNDLYYKTNGIYNGNGPLGHAVSIIGWGNQYSSDGKLLPYWLCRNSFGKTFLNNGFFKILRGENFCKVEDEIWAIEPFNFYNPPEYKPF